MMKRIFFYLLSAISIFSSSVIAKAEPVDVADMRFVPNRPSSYTIVEQIKKLAEQYKSRFEPLLHYLAEPDKLDINYLTISDKIAMTVDEAMYEVRFTTFLVDKNNKVIGRAVITYEFDSKKETINSLYNHVLSGCLLDHLSFCEVQHSLNQSEKSSIEEFASSGKDRNISIPVKDLYGMLGLPTTKDNSLNSNERSSEIPMLMKCNVITKADYETEDIECEEEKCAE